MRAIALELIGIFIVVVMLGGMCRTIIDAQHHSKRSHTVCKRHG